MNLHRKKCTECNGTGIKTEVDKVKKTATNVECKKCKGTGEVEKNKQGD